MLRSNTKIKMDSDIGPQIVKIERPVYEQEQLHQDGDYIKPTKNRIKEFFSSCTKCKPLSLISSILPITAWIREYKWTKNLPADMISGFTVAVMHIPQGMAYALLGNVSPIVGIYMAFFPVLVYFFLGTSRHNSMGTFAIVCLMTGKVVLKYADPYYFKMELNDNLLNNNSTNLDNIGYSPIEVATAVTFLVGIIQCGMFTFRLGIASMLLSESLVSGFTTGAAVQVMTSQIKDLFGLNIEKISGNFEVIYTYLNIFESITTTNITALLISTITIFALTLNNEIIKPKVAKLCSFPIPIELMAVVAGTLMSKFLFLETEYAIKTVGDIPQGLPEPILPQISLFSNIVVDCIMIAIVSYALTLSMGLIFAQKLNYEIDANQELLALGVGNLFGSFFSCMPYCASISRSLIQQTVGGITQMTSITSCFILFFILMWIGPFFEPLPKAVLASIIVVALKGMLMNVKDFFKFLRLNKMDAAVWIITFLSVVLIAVDIGLLIGFCLSLLNVLIMGLKPYVCLLGALPDTDIYLDINRYKMVSEINGLKIFHYRGNINFASRTIFRTELYKTIGLNPQKELIMRNKIEKYTTVIVSSLETDNKLSKLKDKVSTGLMCLILDFSAVNYVDPSGVTVIKQIAQEFQKIGVSIFVAGCSSPIYEMMKKCGLVDENEKRSIIRIFPTVHDAAHFAINLFDLNGTTKISTLRI